jgi:hypothetical protein
MGTMSPARFDDLLRWYPPAWRDRYGPELVVLMEDTYGTGKPPLRSRLGIMRAGLIEHFGEFGFRSGGNTAEGRVESGSRLVLCAWALFVIAGIGFAKFAEHWDAVTPPNDQRLPGDAFNIVQWAAVVGALVVMAAAAVAAPSLVRLLRRGGWPSIRRPIRLVVAVSSTTLLVGIGVVVWAGRLTPDQRNGGSVPYELIIVLLALMITITVATCTATAIAVARRLELSHRGLRLQRVMALLLSATMLPIIGGTVVWWASVASRAPRLLSGHPAPAAMVLVGVLMVTGLGLAAAGAIRVARSTPAAPVN